MGRNSVVGIATV